MPTPINQRAVYVKNPVDQVCEWALLPGISTDANNAVIPGTDGNLFVQQVTLSQELFAGGETLPADTGNSVVVTLNDGNTVTVNAGDTVPATISGCIAYDEVSKKATYIGVDTNTFGTAAAATAAGTTTNGVTYAVGDVIITFPDGTSYVESPSVSAALSDPTAGDGLSTVTFANGDVQAFVTNVCAATGDVPATPTQLCY